MPSRLERLARRVRRLRPVLADAAWAVLLVGGVLLFFWLIWNPPG